MAKRSISTKEANSSSSFPLVMNEHREVGFVLPGIGLVTTVTKSAENRVTYNHSFTQRFSHASHIFPRSSVFACFVPLRSVRIRFERFGDVEQHEDIIDSRHVSPVCSSSLIFLHNPSDSRACIRAALLEKRRIDEGQGY